MRNLVFGRSLPNLQTREHSHGEYRSPCRLGNSPPPRIPETGGGGGRGPDRGPSRRRRHPPGGTDQYHLPQLKIGKHSISRLVCGNNPFGAGSHLSVFVNLEMRHYYTPEQILKTLRRCQQVGINTWQAGAGSLDLYRRYLDGGGRMQFMAIETEHQPTIDRLAKAGCIGIAHHGEATDQFFKTGKLDRVHDFLKRVRDAGVPAGVSTHMPAVVETIESKGWDLDYYMTCVYERHRNAADLEKLLGHVPLPVGEVYLRSDPPRMFKMIRQTKRPCLAFKILAAGRLSEHREWVEQAFRETFAAIKPGDGVIVGHLRSLCGPSGGRCGARAPLRLGKSPRPEEEGTGDRQRQQKGLRCEARRLWGDRRGGGPRATGPPPGDGRRRPGGRPGHCPLGTCRRQRPGPPGVRGLRQSRHRGLPRGPQHRRGGQTRGHGRPLPQPPGHQPEEPSQVRRSAPQDRRAGREQVPRLRRLPAGDRLRHRPGNPGHAAALSARCTMRRRCGPASTPSSRNPGAWMRPATACSWPPTRRPGGRSSPWWPACSAATSPITWRRSAASGTGQLGEIRLVRTYFNMPGGRSGALKPAGMCEMEYQIRHWNLFCWLCGDHLVEQACHEIDVANWVLDGHPIRANGMGNRQVRVGPGTGDIWDSHFIEFEHAGGARHYCQARQQPGTWSHVSDNVHGTKGQITIGVGPWGLGPAGPRSSAPRPSKAGTPTSSSTTISWPAYAAAGHTASRATTPRPPP